LLKVGAQTPSQYGFAGTDHGGHRDEAPAHDRRADVA
jgi:hypothetical protein